MRHARGGYAKGRAGDSGVLAGGTGGKLGLRLSQRFDHEPKARSRPRCGHSQVRRPVLDTGLGFSCSGHEPKVAKPRVKHGATIEGVSANTHLQSFARAWRGADRRRAASGDYAPQAGLRPTAPFLPTPSLPLRERYGDLAACCLVAVERGSGPGPCRFPTRFAPVTTVSLFPIVDPTLNCASYASGCAAVPSRAVPIPPARTMRIPEKFFASGQCLMRHQQGAS
jgi:hypothetical protein